VDNSRYKSIVVVESKMLPSGFLAETRRAIEAIAAQDQWSKPDVVEAIRKAVPELRHLDLSRSLDSKL
jgi:hypothetical protein